MKKFNLELAKQGHPLVTRDGRKVSQFIHFESNEIFNCFAVVDKVIKNYTPTGNFLLKGESPSDLFLDDSEPWSPPFIEGEMIEVRDSEEYEWSRRRYLSIDKRNNIWCFPFFDQNSANCWKYARHIKEPSIEITVKIDGKESKLNDLSEETLLKIRRNEGV